MRHPWTVSHRIGLRFYVWKIKHSNFLGTTYSHYRQGVKALRFWSKAKAQAFADALNKPAPGQGEEDDG